MVCLADLSDKSDEGLPELRIGFVDSSRRPLALGLSIQQLFELFCHCRSRDRARRRGDAEDNYGPGAKVTRERSRVTTRRLGPLEKLLEQERVPSACFLSRGLRMSLFLGLRRSPLQETRLKRPKAAFAKLREAGTTRAGSVREESIREPAMQIASDLM